MLDRWRRIPKLSLMGGLTLGLVVVVFAFAISQLQGSLCTLRSDLESRVTSGEAFLIAHPYGIPGIPAATIRQGLDNQRHTLRALSPMVCI